jgi:hypothetical protein
MIRTIALLTLASASAALPSTLFVGFDKPGQGTTNSDAARAAFLAYLNGAGVESFETLNPPDYFSYSSPIPMSFNGFTGGINPSLLSPVKGAGAFSTIGGGNIFIENEPSGWGMDFSKGIRALGFSLNDIGSLHSPGDPITENSFELTLDLATLVIRPYDYGLIGGDSIAWGFIGVIDSGVFSSAAFRHNETTFTRHFKTDLVIAADPSQVPEPSTWAMLFTGAGLVAFGRRRAAPTPTRS